MATQTLRFQEKDPWQDGNEWKRPNFQKLIGQAKLNLLIASDCYCVLVRG